jgi:glutamine amidotransferase
MKVVIVKYDAGNIRSVDFALKRLGVEAIITDDHYQITTADKIILPGVGEAGRAMKYLKERNLDTLIKNLTRPVLGICLGLQLMCTYSEESLTDCLGIFSEKVNRFSPGKKVPHMGWNRIEQSKGRLFNDSTNHQYVYFVHSYYAPTGPDTVATTDYIGPFSAALEKENFYATQFHPEKSGKTGETILMNFLSL